MAPSKGSKRKSESPPESETNVKKYRTRSSSIQKRVSYNEDSNDEAKEIDQEKTQTDSDEDFILDPVGQKHDGSKDEKLVSTLKKMNSRSSTGFQKQQQVQKDSNNSQQVLNSLFKPVPLTSSNIKSELNLSDADTSSSSSDEEDLQQASSLPQPRAVSSISNVPDKKVEDAPSSAVADVWMRNLEALHAEENATVIQEKIPLMSPKTKVLPSGSNKNKGKQLKSSSKGRDIPSGSKADATSTDSPSKSCIVQQLLKLEEPDQDSSSEDDEWEKVIDSSGAAQPAGAPLKSVEITLEVEESWKRKKKKRDLQDLIRLRINRIRKAIQLVRKKII